MTDFAIPVRFDIFLTYYPKVRKIPPDPKKGETDTLIKLWDDGGSLKKELDGWATGNYNENHSYTTCCIQMSHAINMAFHTADASKMIGLRTKRNPPRPTHVEKIKSVANMEFHYIASVDELKGFLTDTFGDGEEISRGANGARATEVQAKAIIQDRPGIMVFMGNSPWGVHTEIWLGDDYNQDWMKRKGPYGDGWAPVWFWSIGDPTLIDV
jgi:Type VI secretion system (T6SS), amidase effector protein 4